MAGFEVSTEAQGGAQGFEQSRLSVRADPMEDEQDALANVASEGVTGRPLDEPDQIGVAGKDAVEEGFKSRADSICTAFDRSQLRELVFALLRTQLAGA